jgi:adenosylcobinamide-phosphate synthase
MSRFIVTLLALLIDLRLGDPPNRLHPLLLMGRWLGWGRRQAPAQRRFWFGALWTLAGAALFALPWKLRIKNSKFKIHPSGYPVIFITNNANYRISRISKKSFYSIVREIRPFAPFVIRTFNILSKGGRWLIHPSAFTPALRAGASVLHPLFLKPVFAYRALRRAALDVHAALAADNLPEARRLLSWHLVSRDTSQLTAAEIAGAAIESVAENITDSLTAPLLAYAIGGLPAAWAYRFVNTADAMWGYRTPEFEQLGKFPARLDDVLNWLPARLTGWLLVLAAWLTGQSGRGAARAMLAQHGRTASLNAGWTMSAMAGALGVTLTKRGVYALEGGPAEPCPADIGRALRLADVAALLSLPLLAAVCFAVALPKKG